MAENRIYGYARVSKQDGMTIENQEFAINKWAKENNVTLITPEHMKIINDKRNKEKQRK